MSKGRHLDNWIDGYVKYLENTESPDLFKKWVAISSVAAVMKRKCKIEWHQHKDTYPNMFVVLVGPAAIGKGISMGPAEDMLAELGVRTSAQSTTPQALIEEMISGRKAEESEDSCLTIFSQEFSVFLGKQNHDLIAMLTNWFDCPNHWSYMTKARGEEKIVNLYLNVIGATTPGILQKTLTEDAISGGFTSRVILVFSDVESKIIPIPAVNNPGKELYTKLLLDLQRIGEMHGYFRVTQEVVDLWVEWYVRQKKEAPFKTHKQLCEYTGRRPMHLLKLMMIYSAARSDEMIIREEDFKNAWDCLRETESQMANAFRGYGRNELAQFVELAMEEIRVCGILYVKDFIRSHRSDVTAEDMERIIGTLVAMGFCKLIQTDKGKILKYVPEKKK